MRFWLGLAIGLALGATGTYLALERPWRSGPAAADDQVAEAPADAGVEPAGKKPRRRGRRSKPNSSRPEPYPVDDTIVLTDADRRLVWRGQAVALPARSIDMAGDTAGGGDGRPLDDGEIASGIDAGSAPMIDCIKQAVGGAPLSAQVTLKMLVGGDGRVDTLRVRAPSYLHEHGLLACARRAARSFRFAATGAPTVVTAPFHLN